MRRRAVLAAAGATATVGLAGCLERVFGGSYGATDDVVLDEPDRYDQLRAARDNGDLAHPVHADELPAVSVPDALSDRTISTHEYVGERHLLSTFIFTRCTMACPGLVASLAQVQARTQTEGHADQLAFMPMTFDPEYDTAEILREFSTDLGANVEDPAWHFLRPESHERAQTVVADDFGVQFWELSEQERDDFDMPDNMVWDHVSAIVLANADGYVERMYTGSRIPDAAGLLQDVDTLRERW